MNKLRYFIALAGVGSTVATITALVGPSAEASTKGPVHFYTITTADNSSSVVLTGTIGDYGTDKPLAGNYNVLEIKLVHGTFEADITKLNRAVSPVVNSNSCSFTYSGTAPVQFSHGTGSYAGLRGSATVTISGAGVLAKLSSGKCQESQSSEPIFVISSAVGTGTVSIP
jgi:hypothetical protein